MMQRLLFLLAFACLACTAALGQDSTAYVQPRQAKPDRIPIKDRLWFGGGIGLSFGTVTAIQLDPIVGLHLDKAQKLSTGLGVSYNYFRDNRFAPAYEMSAYGYRAFTRYRLLEPVFLHAEFLHLNMEPYYYFMQDKGRIWVPHLLVGGGYAQSAGGKAVFYLQVLFEVLQDPNSFYAGQGPILSGGVGVGF
ncbi:MAG: hypothetical protein KDB93_05340 [Flavobacteriales bacterium]|nr:hypothetical protein [Flavobacteriales bacterium]